MPSRLRKFTGAYPYLALIVRAKGIADPCDRRVVEVRQLYDALRAWYGKQLSRRTLDLVLGKAPATARPHHSFHVFDVHSRAGEMAHRLETMDNCRIRWGA